MGSRLKRFVVRVVLLYSLVAIVLLMYLYIGHRLSLRNYAQMGGLAGLGGLVVYLMLTRFGSGSVEDAFLLDEQSEQRRKIRRAWLLSALVVAILLLLSGLLYTLWS
ncbi:MAG: hypothetical protein OWT28_10670 [Firmicutes bacterium]|nr:hypothetical protein [Bacillota bacterium]